MFPPYAPISRTVLELRNEWAGLAIKYTVWML